MRSTPFATTFNVAVPEEADACNKVVVAAQVSEFEGRTLAKYFQNQATPTLLKREMCEEYANSPEFLYSKVHENIQHIIETFIPPAMKKHKAF